MEIRLCKEDELNNVLVLQQEFLAEDCCNGICLDTLEDIKNKVVFIVEANKIIIGYAFGRYEIVKKDKTYMKRGEKSFYIDEIYISSLYRNNGYGKKLINHITNYVKKQGCANIQVVAVSKNYKSLLKFYIEELDFLFYSAWLIKRI